MAMNEHEPLTRRAFLEQAAVVAAIGGLSVPHAPLNDARLIGGRLINGELDALSLANGWLNSPPLTAALLRGKVVLVQFWTFTCINWLRTLPYVRTWASKYGDAGLVTIGVHTPEFGFEHDKASVQRLARDLNVTYPIAIDNDYAIWNGFRNQYWPALYLIDATGRVRHHQFGEGGVDESERMIQKLLIDAGAREVDRQLAPVEGQGLEAAANWTSLATSETYVGYARTDKFASPGGAVHDRSHVYAIPATLRRNEWALADDWTVRGEGIELNQAGGRIAFRFHARDLHLVMGPPASGRPVRFRIVLDGQAPGASHGIDADTQGNGVANDQRLYQLIRQRTPIEDRTLEIEFRDRGAEAFSFTFG
jgi:thiol-disulfide isomerase/thioredoxin